jgi:mannose-6-phosphate isomerase-like protein (cupin superfamily)
MKYIDRRIEARRIDKSWGYEICRVNNQEQDYCSKIIFIKARCSTSMHYHIQKHETFYVRVGNLRVDTLDQLQRQRAIFLMLVMCLRLKDIYLIS